MNFKAWFRTILAYISSPFILLFVFLFLTLPSVLWHRLAFVGEKIFSKVFLWICGVSVSSEGVENLINNHPCVVASNHASLFDIPILASVMPVPYSWLAKKSLFRIPIIGWGLKIGRHISVDRVNAVKGKKAIERAVDRLKSGKSIIIFPEGTRTVDGRLRAFKRGFAEIASRADVKVVPVAIVGSFEIKPKNRWYLVPVNVKVIFGKPVDIGAENTREVTKILRNIVGKMIERESSQV